MSDGGKGSSPRPFSVSNEEYANRWDAIFSRDINKKKEILENLIDKKEDKVKENKSVSP